MKTWSILYSCLILVLSANVHSSVIFEQNGKVPMLIELYTSEGCSSCPPADNYLSSLVDKEFLWKTWIPIAFHVDYWDYIGWPDRFAQAKFTQRQKQHHQNRSIRNIYTPGWLVDGKEWRGFFRGRSLPSTSSRIAGKLTATYQQQKLQVTYQPQEANQKMITAHVVIMQMDQQTQVKAGENRGRLLQHEFVAINKQQQRGSKTDWTFSLPKIPTDKQHALAVWLTYDFDSQPIQAVGGWLP